MNGHFLFESQFIKANYQLNTKKFDISHLYENNQGENIVAFLSGTRDRDGYPLVVIPAPYSNGQCHTETYWKVLEKSLKKLLPAEHCIEQSSNGNKFSVVIDGSKQKLRDIKMTIRIVQQCLKDRVYVVYIVQPNYTKARFLLWLQKTSLPVTTNFIRSHHLKHIGCQHLFSNDNFRQSQSTHRMKTFFKFFSALLKGNSNISLIETIPLLNSVPSPP